MEKGICRSCGANIYWIESKGKKQPLDVKHKMVYVFIAVSHSDGEKIDDTIQQGGTWVLRKGHESHFATCKDADAWRKK